MNKLPVGQIISQAYAFTFGEIGTVIGLTWIPTLLNTVAAYFMLRTYAVTLGSLETGAPPTDLQALLPFPLAILSLFLVGMIGVALTRQVLGLRKGPALAHFALGGEELRVFAGFIGLYALAVLFLLAFMTVVGLLAVVANGAAAAVAAAGSLLAIGFLIYATMRLGFLLVPSVVADGHFGLTRSWKLTSGNFWRIVAILMATLVPLMLVSDIVSALVVGPLPQSPATPPADLNGIVHMWAEQFRAMSPSLPKLMGVSVVLAPLFSSLFFTPAALAYQVLAGKAITVAKDG